MANTTVKSVSGAAAAKSTKKVSRDALREVLLNVVRSEVMSQSGKIGKVLEHAEDGIGAFQAGLPLIRGGKYSVKFLVKVGKASDIDSDKTDRPGDLDGLLAELSEA